MFPYILYSQHWRNGCFK